MLFSVEDVGFGGLRVPVFNEHFFYESWISSTVGSRLRQNGCSAQLHLVADAFGLFTVFPPTALAAFQTLWLCVLDRKVLVYHHVS